jgi:3-phenylpropionate/trans-cinnamate dioxygenase ferredoxin reductase subunit
MMGLPASYDRLPYFFSDQYDLGLEYTGYVPAGGADRVVVRGDPAAREFIAFWLSGDRVLAGMNVNVWDVTGEIGELIRSGAPADPARLADPAVPLGEVLVPAE